MRDNNDIICIDLDNMYTISESNNSNVENEHKSFFYFKYVDFSKANSVILPYQVPIWIKFFEKDFFLGLDKNIVKVIEKIDGISYVKKITTNIDLNHEYIEFILYNLLILDYIFMVDIFQFSNIYRANKDMRLLLQENLKKEFIEFCRFNLIDKKNFLLQKTIMEVYSNNYNSSTNNKMSIISFCDIKNYEDVLLEINDSKFTSFYCLLTKSKSVYAFLNKLEDFKIFISLFVAFGVYKKLIRRVNVYVLEKNKEHKDIKEHDNYNNSEFLGLLDGKHSLDEVCCETNKSLKEVEAILKGIEGINMIYK